MRTPIVALLLLALGAGCGTDDKLFIVEEPTPTPAPSPMASPVPETPPNPETPPVPVRPKITVTPPFPATPGVSVTACSTIEADGVCDEACPIDPDCAPPTPPTPPTPEPFEERCLDTLPEPTADGSGCAGGYTLVPATATAPAFCVSQFEMKLQGGRTISRPQCDPIRDVSRDDAIARCASLGQHLITNAEWQQLAREIESVGANWSGGTAGVGFMNRGNFSAEFGPSDPSKPCATTGFPPRFAACEDPTSADFDYRRTHFLSTGHVVWDVGGNSSEWTATDVGASAPSLFRGTVCESSGIYRDAYGAAGNYACNVADPNPYGFGCIEGDGGSVIIRGGGSGMQGSPWDSCPGIFYVNINAFWTATGPTGPSFRCAYNLP